MLYRLWRLRALWLLTLLAAGGCGAPAQRDIAEVRQIPADQAAPPPAALSTPERMGLSMPPPGPATVSGGPSAGAAAGSAGPEQPGSAPPSADAPFAWTLPEGWREQPPRPMRLATFAVGDAECYISVLAGDGGGRTANINRWRRQMGLEPLDDAAIAALPALTVLGGPAPFIEMEGTYRDMTGNTLEQAGFLGTLRELEGRTLFIRMTGPAAAVRAHKAEFQAFCESLREWHPS